MGLMGKSTFAEASVDKWGLILLRYAPADKWENGVNEDNDLDNEKCIQSIFQFSLKAHGCVQDMPVRSSRRRRFLSGQFCLIYPVNK